MREILLVPLCLLGLIASSSVFGQTTNDTTKAANLAQATNFSLPSSIAFNLLDVNPSQVYRPGFSKDFKFDWVVKDNKIASNLAIEGQPIWLFFYKNTDYSKFSKHTYLEKIFSSLTISIGTSTKDSIHSLAWGAKVNLYAKKNPIYDTAYINKIGNFVANSQFINKIDSLQLVCDFEQDGTKKKLYQKAIDSLKTEYKKIEDKHFAEIDKYKEKYEKDNWNSTLIDLGYGRVYNYLSQSIDSLSFQNNGSGLWISGNFGIGSKILINGMFKYSNIAKNDITTVGANFRYGGLNTNFFVEGLYNSASNDNLKKITIAYGGEFKIKNSFALQFGLRTDYTKDFKFKNLIPVVNFNYLLGQ